MPVRSVIQASEVSTICGQFGIGQHVVRQIAVHGRDGGADRDLPALDPLILQWFLAMCPMTPTNRCG